MGYQSIEAKALVAAAAVAGHMKDPWQVAGPFVGRPKDLLAAARDCSEIAIAVGRTDAELGFATPADSENSARLVAEAVLEQGKGSSFQWVSQHWLIAEVWMLEGGAVWQIAVVAVDPTPPRDQKTCSLAGAFSRR